MKKKWETGKEITMKKKEMNKFEIQMNKLITWQKQIALLLLSTALIHSQSNRRTTCSCHVINLFICSSNLFIPFFFIISFLISRFFFLVVIFFSPLITIVIYFPSLASSRSIQPLRLLAFTKIIKITTHVDD